MSAPGAHSSKYGNHPFHIWCKKNIFENALVSTAQKMKLFIKDFFSKYDQIRSFFSKYEDIQILNGKLHFLCSVSIKTLFSGIMFLIQWFIFRSPLSSWTNYFFTEKMGSTALVFLTITAQKMKFSIKDFFSKCDQIRKKLPIWSHLVNKSFMENYIFFVVKKFLF